MRRLAFVSVLGLLLALAGCFFLFNDPPTAVITASPQQGNCPLTVAFSSAGSYDDEGITSVVWDFGDGWAASTTTGQHTFTHPGTYTVRLTVEDAYGETDSVTMTIVVYDLATYDRTFTWHSHGETWTWKIAVPQSLHAYYDAKWYRPVCYDVGPCNWYVYVTDPDDDPFIETLSENLLGAIAAFYNDSPSAYYGFLQFALDFVTGAIPYTLDSLPNEWPRYPLETLVEVVGDCEDTAILYCSIVRPQVQTTHLLFFPTHVASAVPVDWSFVDSRDYTVGYYEYQGAYYAFCETTGDPPGYWRVGELPDSLRAEWTGGDFWFYDVGLRSGMQGKGLVHEPPSGF